MMICGFWFFMVMILVRSGCVKCCVWWVMVIWVCGVVDLN